MDAQLFLKNRNIPEKNGAILFTNPEHILNHNRQYQNKPVKKGNFLAEMHIQHTISHFYNEQKKETKNGTEKSIKIPWKIAITVHSLPHTCVMTGNVTSIVVAPPAQMGANLPK